MKIRYRRTGGIANIKTKIEFDSDSLPQKKLATLERLLKTKSSGKPAHPDDFIHELEVMDSASPIKRQFQDSEATREALELFDYLVHIAVKKNSRS